jgi:hypothetical protein
MMNEWGQFARKRGALCVLLLVARSSTSTPSRRSRARRREHEGGASFVFCCSFSLFRQVAKTNATTKQEQPSSHYRRALLNTASREEPRFHTSKTQSFRVPLLLLSRSLSLSRKKRDDDGDDGAASLLSLFELKRARLSLSLSRCRLLQTLFDQSKQNNTNKKDNAGHAGGGGGRRGGPRIRGGRGRKERRGGA